MILTKLGPTSMNSTLMLDYINQNSNKPTQETTSPIGYQRGENKEEKVNHLVIPHYKQFIKKNKPIHKNITKKSPKMITNIKTQQKMNHSNFMRRTFQINDLFFKNKKHQKNLEPIFDWMMEAASLLRIPKNAYYRSLLIVQKLYNLGKLINKKQIFYSICGAFCLSVKFEGTRINFIDIGRLYPYQALTLNQLISAEGNILKVLKWNIPVLVFPEEDIQQILTLWQQYIKTCKSHTQINSKIFSKIYMQSQNTFHYKFYVEIVYVLDFLVISCREYLTAKKFIKPILISLYILISICVGDVNLCEPFVENLVYNFINSYQELKENNDLNQLRSQAQRFFKKYNILNFLGSIPLNLNFESIRKSRYQFYIRKIEHSD